MMIYSIYTIIIVLLYVILMGITFEGSRSRISFIRLLTTISIWAIALTFVWYTLTLEESPLKDNALLLSPIILAFALVSLQEFFSYRTSKQIEEIHAVLKPKKLKKESPTPCEKVLVQNEELIAEINSLKKAIDALNSIVTSKSIPETIIIENRRSLISFSPKFIKKK